MPENLRLSPVGWSWGLQAKPGPAESLRPDSLLLSSAQGARDAWPCLTAGTAGGSGRAGR